MKNQPIVRLSGAARKVLTEMAGHGATARTVRRAQALLWLEAGEPVELVAQRLHVSRQMLYALVARYTQRANWPVHKRIQDATHSGRPTTKGQLVHRAV